MNKKFINYTNDETLNIYFKDVRKSKVITHEDEIELAKRIQKGDEEAMTQLIFGNIKFVVKIAKQYQGRGLSLSDLISEGNCGLIKAATKYDHTKGHRFISYAVWWIRQSITQSLNDNSRTIRLPINLINKLILTKKNLNKFEFQNERAASFGDIIDDSGELYTGLYNDVDCISLDKPSDDDDCQLSELIASDVTDEFEILSKDVRIKSELENIFSVLDEREIDIIKCYFGIDTDHEPMTLDGIGDKYKLTKERIRQIKDKAIRKLRHNADGLFTIINE